MAKNQTKKENLYRLTREKKRFGCLRVATNIGDQTEKCYRSDSDSQLSAAELASASLDMALCKAWLDNQKQSARCRLLCSSHSRLLSSSSS